jgi:hypothetical protein
VTGTPSDGGHGRSGGPDAVAVEVVVDNTSVAGQAIDLREGAGEGVPDASGRGDRADAGSVARLPDGASAPPATTVVEAVRADGPVDGVRVDCPDPGPAFEHVGHLRPEPSTSLRAALAAAARSRGDEPPEADALAAAREELASHDVPTVDVAAAERRVAAAGEAERELRERVAALRGRVQALRETADHREPTGAGNGTEAGAGNGDDDRPGTADGGRGRALDRGRDGGSDAATGTSGDAVDPVAEAEVAYRDAIRELTEAETERIAAQQRLEGLRERIRTARDARRRRLELQDRVANLERAARESLAGLVYEEFAAAVASMPGDGDPGDAPGEFEGDPATARLAVARVADLDAPIVDALGRFPDVRTAARRLDAAVIRL